MKTIEKLEEVYLELKKEEVGLKTKYYFVHKKTKNSAIKMSIGRIWLNLVFPEKEPLYDEPINKSRINKIIGKFIDKYSPEETSEAITILNQEAYKLATYFPQSIKLSDIIVSKEILDKKQKLVDRINNNEEFDFTLEINKLIKELFDDLNKKDSGLYNIIMSGARGDPALVGALILAKGASVDIEGNVIDYIHESQNTGYGLKSFFANANEARSTQFTKSLSSQTPGVIARSVAYACNNVNVIEQDCKSTKLIEYPIDEKNFSKIQGRYFLNPKNGKLEIVDETKTFLINTIVKMRSPIYCKTKKGGLCEVCYGLLYQRNETSHVGLVASTMSNDLGISAAMKSRHKSSQIATSKSNFMIDLTELK